MGSLLRHLLHRKRNQSKELLDMYSEHTNRGTRPTYMELKSLVEVETRSLSHFFIVFDAFDECTAQNDTRTKLLNELKSLSKLRLVVTGRPYVGTIISTWLKDISELPIRARNEDIEKYVEGRIINENLTRHCLNTDCLKEKIQRTVVNKAGGMSVFLLTVTDTL
jgi:hypothetical protein